MNSVAKIIIGVVVVVVVGVGAWFLMANRSNERPVDNGSDQQGSEVALTITYDGTGFAPDMAVVQSGDTVEIMNNSDRAIYFSSDPHPTHTDNPELNAGDIEPGETRTVTLTTTGEWGYHDHFEPGEKGTITVE